MAIPLEDMRKYLPGCDHAAAVTPTDTGGLNLGGVTPPQACRRLWLGAAGNVKVDTQGGESGVTFTAVAAGFLDVHATRVYATGTTAGNQGAVGIRGTVASESGKRVQQILYVPASGRTLPREEVTNPGLRK